MFGTDYPHAEGTWPNTRDWIRIALDGVPEPEARKLLGENAARMYGIDLQSLTAHVERVGPEYSDLCGGPPVSSALITNLHWRSGFLGHPVHYESDALDPLIEADESGIALGAR